MKTTKLFVCLILLSAINLVAADKNLKQLYNNVKKTINIENEGDLKGVYKNVTTAINSELLTNAGSIEISGSLSYHSFSTEFSSGEQVDQHIIEVEPAFSYFVINNLSLGLQLSYMNQKTEYKSSNISQNTDQTYVGPIVKFYFGKKRVRPFILTDYMFLAGDQYDGKAIDVGAGVLYHLTGNIGLNLFGKYGFISSDDKLIDSQSRMYIGFGISGFIF